MAMKAPEHVSVSPLYDYSTLEAAEASHFRQSTLEPVPAYQAQNYPSENKEAYQRLNGRPEDSEVGTSSGVFMGRQICGMRMKLALVAAIILLLVVIGGVVGGVVGSQQKRENSVPPYPISGGTSTSLTSSITSTTSATSTTTSDTLSPYTPFPDTKNLFRPSLLYNFSNSNLTKSGKQSYMEASYDPDTNSGNVNMRVRGTYTEAESAILQWQIRPVYSSWRNSTADFNATGLTRTYWISSRSFGPDLRLTLDDDRARTVDEGADTKDWRLHMGLKPKDLGNAGQYWYFSLWTPRGKNPRTAKYYKMHNVVMGTEFTVCKTFDDGFVMLSKDFSGEEWEQWDVLSDGSLPKVDGRFNWITNVEANPGSS